MTGIELGEVLFEDSAGTLTRGRIGDDEVLVDGRSGPLAWSPPAPPRPILSPLQEVQLPTGPAVAYAHVVGRPLDQAVGGAPVSPRRALTLTRELAEAIGWLHRHGRCHLAITPAQILVDGDALALVGAAQARPLGRGHADGADLPGSGALVWLAPEQTGRVARPIDHRTDLYGLGAVLLRLLTGRPPFSLGDVLETLHAVLAQSPPAVPGSRVLTELTARLLAKDARGRYQTAAGLIEDLDRCLSALEDDRLEMVELSGWRRTDALTLPDGLYGRDEELAALFGALDSVQEGPSRLVLVRGRAGSGKSALIQELRQRQLLLLAGKLDPSDAGRPYAGVLRALEAGLTRVLSADQATLERTRALLGERLGQDGGVLTPLLPRLPLLLGDLPEPAPFDPEAAQRRLRRCLAAVLDALAPAELPLVLVLDDLQWADRATFLLIDAFLAAVPRLLVLGAYREEEVDEDHPVGSVDAETIQVGALGRAAVRELVAACLYRAPEDVAELADELARRTRGNPFALRWSLRELDRLGVFDAGPDGARTWRSEQLAGLGVADNIAAVLAGRLESLSPTAQRVLQAASVAGTWLEPQLIAHALEIDVEAVDAGVAEGLGAELVEVHQRAGARRSRFAHDRIREAGQASLSDEERDALRLALGRALARAEAPLLEITPLLNPVRAQLDAAEQAQLAGWNIEAAAIALRSRALTTAREVLSVAWELLGADPWVSAPTEAWRCRSLQLEVAHQEGDTGPAETMARELIERAPAPADAARAWDLLQATLGRTKRVTAALDACYDKLAAIGHPLPRHPHMGHVMMEMTRTMLALRGTDHEALLTQEPTTDPNVIAYLQTVSQMTFVEKPEQFLQIALRAVRLTVQHGPSRDSGFCWSSYGTILCGPFGKLEEGDAYGKLGLALVRRFGADDVENRVMVNYYAFVAHWTHPWRESITGLDAARDSALRFGDVTYLPGATLFITALRVLTGVPLPQVLEVTRGYARELETDEHNHRRMGAYVALVELLSGVAERNLLDDFADLEVPDDQLTTASLHMLRGLGALLLGKIDAACAAFDRVRPIGDALFGLPLMPAFKAYDAIAALAAAEQRPGQRRALVRIARAHRKFLAPRAEVAPFNLAHRVAFIDAELARVNGEEGEALRHYAAAAEAARQHGFVNDEALVWLRQASLHATAGRAGLAERDRGAARATLARWGAEGVLATLPAAPRSDGDADVDVETVARAGAAIGRELHLDPLLVTLTGLLLKNAGAQRAALVTRANGGWTLEALEDLDGHTRPGLDLDASGELLCVGLARYVLRSGESVRVDDLSVDPTWAGDDYVRASGARSVLVLPTVRAGRVDGLIYLEHRGMRSAFDPSGVRVVRLLASQIAVSIENARLFDATEQLKGSFERFVPKQMLQVLGREISEVALGDNVEGEMTVLFADIRSFTRLSAALSPAENFRFINAYLSRMEPLITACGGFVDKYIGDAIMAVFPGSADGAVRAGRAMLAELEAINQERAADASEPLQVGVGVHTGPLMLGTVGGAQRLQGTVIGDTVNVAARVESETKNQAAPMLITAATRSALRDPAAFSLRPIGLTPLRGRGEPVALFAVDG